MNAAQPRGKEEFIEEDDVLMVHTERVNRLQ